MKKSILTLTAVFSILGFAYGQERSNAKSIFNKNTELKGFGTFELRIGQVIDDTGLIMGATAGVTVNKVLLFGLGGYGIAAKTTIQGIAPDKPLRIYGGYGGLLLGFSIFPREIVHLSFPVLVGVGNLDVVDENYFPNSSEGGYTIENSGFFVVEPTALLEFNITRFFHMGMGASYRYVDGLNLENVSNEDFTGWTGTLMFKFGRF